MARIKIGTIVTPSRFLTRWRPVLPAGTYDGKSFWQCIIVGDVKDFKPSLFGGMRRPGRRSRDLLPFVTYYAVMSTIPSLPDPYWTGMIAKGETPPQDVPQWRPPQGCRAIRPQLLHLLEEGGDEYLMAACHVRRIFDNTSGYMRARKERK